MDCREFRDKHSLYVDLRCSLVEENKMRGHVRGCPKCSRHDTVIRRSLLLVRNLPTIEPSPDFRARLDARLRTITPFSAPASRSMRSSLGAFTALAAGVAFVTYLASEVLRRGSDDMVLTPVVAARQEQEPSPVSTAAYVATVPTGMSVWPAIMVASQAPIHFVAAEMASER